MADLCFSKGTEESFLFLKEPCQTQNLHTFHLHSISHQDQGSTMNKAVQMLPIGHLPMDIWADKASVWAVYGN